MIKYFLSGLCCLLIVLIGTSAAYADASAVVSLDPPSYQGKCPASVMVKTKITSTTAGAVSFRYVFSTGYTTPFETLYFTAPGTTQYDKGLLSGTPSLPQYPTSGWVAMEIGGKLSNKATFNVTCKDPDIAVTDLSWTPYSTQYKNAPVPLGSIKVNYKNQGTGNSGPVSLSITCAGVPGTGPFGETPVCPQGIFPRVTAPISTDIAAGEQSSTGIVGTGTMPPSWGGGKYKLKAEMKIMDNSQETDTTNNAKELEINVPFAVMTDVNTIMLEGTNYKGECSSKKNVTLFKAKIAGNGYGVIKYQWILDGVAGNVQELTYRVDDILKEIALVTLPMENKTGWGAIKILSPGSKESSHVAYSITCTTGYSIDPAFLGKLNFSLAGWKNLGKLSAAPQGCQACAATAGQIQALDQRTLPLVQKGEGLVQKINAKALNKTDSDTAARELKEIDKQLDAALAQRKTLVDQYNKQVAAFNAQPRKATPVRK